ncbi:uncharacterized protein [Spinacia oleracea]|uniref:Tc1-like transposase DDE domain-containing protein n=1 Tax=Spinacia oleracea TaxID=3562 RepID=A0A9R0JHZ2_SPIOL|nr:uncharacterized protein LOC110806141 [Spinacia oleracea]
MSSAPSSSQLVLPSTREQATGTPQEEHALHREPRLSVAKKQLILQFLDRRTTYGYLPRGSFLAASIKFNYTPKTIRKLWHKAIADVQAQKPIRYESYYKSKCGAKYTPIPAHKITAIEIKNRTSFRLMGKHLDLAASIVHRHMKQGELKPHTNLLKPGLTEHNKRARISYCLNFIMQGTHTTNPTYYDMHNVVRIDEKWFYLTKKDQRMLLAPNEVPPHRAVKSKNFIPKIMFMGAVARPRWDREGNCTFDGKLGLFPFTMEVPTKRSSCNRQRGTMETKPINKVNKDVFRKMITMKIIPAIMEKWPQEDSEKVIIIQEDNAKPHCGADIHEFIQSHNQNGFRFFWAPQPPNSPDLNILDLGFFRSIQSKYEKSMPKNVTVLIKEVGQAFNDTHPNTLSNVWYLIRYNIACVRL